MARHQIRRLPFVENGRLVGIVAQADIALALKENAAKTGELVEAISERPVESAGSVAGRYAQHAFARDFLSPRRCAMSWARSSSLPPSSTSRSEGSARR